MKPTSMSLGYREKKDYAYYVNNLPDTKEQRRNCYIRINTYCNIQFSSEGD